MRDLASALGVWIARVGATLLLTPAACGGEGAPPASRGLGQVQVATIVDLGGPGTHVTTIDASFTRPETLGAECHVAAHGVCQVMTCTIRPHERPDAGQLTLENADGSFAQVLLADSSGAYAFGDETGAFAPGDSVAARFAGAEVPAFEVSGVFPEPLVLTEPVVPSGGDPLAVARGADLTIRWTGGVTGTTFSLSQDTSPTILRCSVPSERGVLTVPASALAALEPGRLDLRTVTPVEVQAGKYDVTLALLSAAVNADAQGVSLALDP